MLFWGSEIYSKLLTLINSQIIYEVHKNLVKKLQWWYHNLFGQYREHLFQKVENPQHKTTAITKSPIKPATSLQQKQDTNNLLVSDVAGAQVHPSDASDVKKSVKGNSNNVAVSSTKSKRKTKKRLQSPKIVVSDIDKVRRLAKLCFHKTFIKFLGVV